MKGDKEKVKDMILTEDRKEERQDLLKLLSSDLNHCDIEVEVVYTE